VADQTKNNTDVILGNYKVLTRIGSGGMAAVYKAVDLATGRVVALKVLSPELAKHEAFVKRFLDESVAAAIVGHPNVIQIHSIGEQEKKHHFFVMEYVENGSLGRLLNGERPVPLARAVDYVLQAARGLQAAFQLGIVHRDVKPSNLLLTKEGTVKVADFGLAQMDDPSEPPEPARKAIGTPAYMSPEQAQFDVVDHRSDIYSLGVTFFHLATGRQPFRANTPQEVVHKHSKEPMPSPRGFNPRLPQSVCNVIQKMMAKLPIERYQTYEELIANLERVWREISEPPSAQIWQERVEFLRRRAEAFGIDNALVFVPAALIVLAGEGLDFFSMWRGFHIACAIGLVALTVYSTVMLARFGRTLGMMDMEVRLVGGSGRPPWWGVTLVRSLALNVFYLFLIFPDDLMARGVVILWLVNLAAAVFRKDGQAFHDVLCGTRVRNTEVTSNQ